jgi:hypothetical protein
MRVESFGVELSETVYALDSTTIDLCLSVFPWALFRAIVTLFFNEVSQIPYGSIVTARTRLAQKVELAGKPGRFLPTKEFDDLNPIGKRHWSYLEFIQHVDPITRLALPDPENYKQIFMPPTGNIQNLATGTIEGLSRLPPRQRQRFFVGEYSDEIEGALWTFESLDHARVEAAPQGLRQVVVAVDPSGTSGDEDTRSDDVGIVVAGRGDDGKAYVLADRTCNLPPEGWGRVVATAFHEFKADHVIGEKNFGGDMVRAAIHAVDPNIPYKAVDASRGKAVRAEPVSVLYGHVHQGEWIQDRVRHVGKFPELESELLDFSTAGYVGLRSPNRADSLIWCITELMLVKMNSYGIYELYRQEAEAIMAERAPPLPISAGNVPEDPDLSFDEENRRFARLTADKA